MPYHYICSIPREKSLSSPDYIARGLEGKTTGVISENQYVGIPEKVQPCYSDYVSNIAAFMKATATRRKVTCGYQYKLALDAENYLPIPLPPLYLSPTKPFENEDAKQRFLDTAIEAHGRAAFKIHNKREVLRVENPNPVMLPLLPKSFPNTTCPKDAVCMSSMFEVMNTLRTISLFITTHTYPAFQTEAEDESSQAAVDLTFLLPHENKVNPATTTMRGIKANYNALGKRAWTTYPKEITGVEDMKQVGSAYNYSNGTVIVAKPAPLFPSVNYGPPSEIPNLPGFLFPYFSGMVFADKAVIVRVFRRFFFNTFGEGPSANEAGWKKWYTFLDSWVNTETGKMIAHLCMMIETTLEAQARLFVLCSHGEYLGSVIIGCRFNIHMNGVTRKADTAITIRALASKLDKHSSSIERLQDIYKRMTLEEAAEGEDIEIPDEPVEEIKPDMSSPRRIHSLFKVLPKPTDVEELKDLSDCISHLTFDQSFLPITDREIVKALRSMSLNEEPSIDAPLQLDQSCLFNKSIYYSVMSQFGPTAPSFFDVGGQDVKIPKGLQDDDPMSAIAEGETEMKMPRIFVTIKKISLASTDMAAVYNKRIIRQNNKERAANLGYRVFTFKKGAREAIWGALKSIPVKEDKKGKRKAVDDLEEVVDADGDTRVVKKGAEVIEDIGFTMDF